MRFSPVRMDCWDSVFNMADNIDREPRGSTSGANSSGRESALSEAVTLLERSVSLLRETPSVLPPAGSNHGSTREERAVANYRNIFPGPSGTQTAHQSGQRASGSVALANSFASSWPSLGSGGGRQSSSSSSKKSTFRFQPYKVKETWTHEFCVLADKDQRQVPSTSMKQELREAGLGQRRIVFRNKKGDFKHIQEGLYNNFPKLSEAGGFELYRQQDGKNLCYIKPPASGYTIPFLKYTYGIKSAILYVLPIQRSLSMDPEPLDEEEVDESNIQTQECYRCHMAVPLRTLREHLNTCTVTAAHDGKPSTEVEAFDDSADDDPPSVFHVLPSTSSDTNSQQRSSSTPSNLEQLQGMFPEKSLSVLELALKTSIGLEGAVDQLLETDNAFNDSGSEFVTKDDSNLPVDCKTILSHLAPKGIIPKRICVKRDSLLNDSIIAFKSANFDYDQPFRITFENEPAIDGGGPMREYFSLLLRAIVSPFSSVRLFEGQEHSLLPMHNTDALRAGLFKVAGRMIACSVINGSTGFPCLASPVYSYLVTQSVEDAVELAASDEIPDPEAREALQEIDNLEDFAAVPDRVSELLVQAGFTKQLSKDNKGGAMMSIMIHSLISSRKAELDQFALGLGPVLKAARENPTVCKPLFVYDEENCKVTPEKFKALLYEANLDDKLKGYFHDYIDSKDESGLKDLLSFCTAVPSIPPMGFDNPSVVTVTSICSTLPNANTLSNGIGTSF